MIAFNRTALEPDPVLWEDIPAGALALAQAFGITESQLYRSSSSSGRAIVADGRVVQTFLRALAVQLGAVAGRDTKADLTGFSMLLYS